MLPIIQEAQSEHYDGIWDIFQDIIQAGDTYVYDENMPKDEFIDTWCHNVKTYVALYNNRVVGSYIIKPNFPGRGAHVANCGYIVDKNSRGMSIG